MLSETPTTTPTDPIGSTDFSGRTPISGRGSGDGGGSGAGGRTRGSATLPLTARLTDVIATWSRSQYQLVTLAAEFADSPEWIVIGSPTAAHWLASVADVETCTAREWIRVGRRLRVLHASADAFEAGELSYSKVRALTRIATPENEAELLEIARSTTAGDLGRALAAWVGRNSNPDDLDAHQQRQRSVKWRLEPDGMTVFTLRLPPLLASMLISFLTTWVMRTRSRAGRSRSADAWPTVAQQHADALADLLGDGGGDTTTEIVLHVRGDGCTLDDGTPITDTVIERIAPASFVRVLIHDAASRPINASGRHRHPNVRQRRVVKERDRVCVDCGRGDLLEYDHVPAYEQSGHTLVDELELRCAPCHHARSFSGKAGARSSSSR